MGPVASLREVACPEREGKEKGRKEDLVNV